MLDHRADDAVTRKTVIGLELPEEKPLYNREKVEQGIAQRRENITSILEEFPDIKKCHLSTARNDTDPRFTSLRDVFDDSITFGEIKKLYAKKEEAGKE